MHFTKLSIMPKKIKTRRKERRPAAAVEGVEKMILVRPSVLKRMSSRQGNSSRRKQATQKKKSRQKTSSSWGPPPEQPRRDRRSQVYGTPMRMRRWGWWLRSLRRKWANRDAWGASSDSWSSAAAMQQVPAGRGETCWTTTPSCVIPWSSRTWAEPCKGQPELPPLSEWLQKRTQTMITMVMMMMIWTRTRRLWKK